MLKIKKRFEPNGGKNPACQNLWGAAQEHLEENLQPRVVMLEEKAGWE